MDKTWVLLLWVACALALPKPQKLPTFTISQTSTGRWVQGKNTIPYSFNMDLPNKKYKSNQGSGTSQVTTWIFTNGSYYLTQGTCYYLTNLNFANITGGQYKQDLAWTGQQKWYTFPGTPTLDTFFGPITSGGNAWGMFEFWETSGANKGAYKGGMELNPTGGFSAQFLDTTTPTAPPASTFALDAKCNNPTSINNNGNLNVQQKSEAATALRAQKSLVEREHFHRIANELEGISEEEIDEQDLDTISEEEAKEHPMRAHESHGVYEEEESLANREEFTLQAGLTDFFPANKQMDIKSSFNVSGTSSIFDTKGKLQKGLQGPWPVMWANDEANKQMQYAKDYGNGDVVYTYTQPEGSYYPESVFIKGGKPCAFHSEGGYDATTMDFTGSAFTYLGKVDYYDSSVGTTEVWAYIGKFNKENNAKFTPPPVAMIYLGTDGTPRAMLAPNRPSRGGVSESVYTKVNSVVSANFKIPAACSALKTGGCSLKSASACQLKLLTSSIFGSSQCSYMAKARKCFGDSFCGDYSKQVCSSSTAAACKLSFC
eukprot:TRINITY_DN85069_c0_g1_i1.p1 TRINITY_DN85069_c0_g1~~TRINITY_DN85069_c0_g1_i1.p1  ORF type:complete len:543 (+),score=116.85 TRINITY_DN85069_c0_g1_i1:32-1660(+)